jgi:pyruvate/2-oxoglutarate dehydrogenase complex dihydrolipoamide acyltransferase (E2) component
VDIRTNETGSECEEMGELLRVEKWAENLEEVTMGRWLKQEGEEVEAGEGLCEIITEKVTFEYESPISGRLLRIYAPEKSVMPVGYVFGFVGETGEVPPEGIEDVNRRLLDAHTAQLQLSLDSGAERSSAGVEGGGRVRATPAARRVAREHGVSLAEVAEWVGSERPLTAEDVEKYIAEKSGGE